MRRGGYWLTPAGCVATGGHTWDTTDDGRTACTVCGLVVVEASTAS